MPFFPCAHAGHSQWQHATRQVIVQLKAQISMQQLNHEPCLGVVYVSQAYAPHAAGIFRLLAQSLPHVRQWTGCAAEAVLGGDMDYGASSALAVMLPCLEESQYRIFAAGSMPPVDDPELAGSVAMVHGEARHAGIEQQLALLQAALQGGQVVGGLSALVDARMPTAPGGPWRTTMPASLGGTAGVQEGLSGVLLSRSVPMLTMSMQGCRPQGTSFKATRVDGECLLELDGQPALDVLMERLELGSVMAAPRPDADVIWSKVQQTLLAISPQALTTDGKCLEPQSRVLPILGLDPVRRAILLGAHLPCGYAVTLCQRDEQAVLVDIRRACAEISEALVPELAWASGTDSAAPQPHGYSICGAIYVRSQRRQTLPRSAHIDQELQLIRHALGPVPLLGFTSAREVQGSALQHLSAQLIVFIQPVQPL